MSCQENDITAGLRNRLLLLVAVAAVSLIANHNAYVSPARAQVAPNLAQLEQQAATGDAEAIKTLGETLLKDGKTPVERTRGVKLLEQAISLGRLDAMTALGTAYLWGNGVMSDPGKAEALLTRATHGGHAGARRILGEQLITGWVLPQQPRRGLAIIEDGVAAGDARSKGILGRLLLEGKYLTADRERGLSLLEDAVRAKDINSQAALGRAYLQGTGVEPNPEKALDLLTQAAAAGHNSARRELGEALIRGEGIEKDIKAGLDLLQSAVEASDRQSHLVLGQLLLEGTHVAQDRKRATEVLLAFDKLSQDGKGLELLGNHVMKTARSKDDYLLAEKYLRSAGERGRVAAWLTLARAAARGRLGVDSPSKYKKYAQLARRAGVEGLAVLEAERHLWGWGVKADSGKAIQVLAGAAEAGNKRAIRYLIALLRDGNNWNVKPNRRASLKHLEQYGDVLPPAEKTSMSLLIRASGQRSMESIEALSAEIARSDVSKTAAFYKELFAANPNLSVYLLQQRLRSEQIFNGLMSGMFTKPTLQAIKKACGRQTEPVRCSRNLTSADTVAAILSQ